MSAAAVLSQPTLTCCLQSRVSGLQAPALVSSGYTSSRESEKEIQIHTQIDLEGSLRACISA